MIHTPAVVILGITHLDSLLGEVDIFQRTLNQSGGDALFNRPIQYLEVAPL